MNENSGGCLKGMVYVIGLLFNPKKRKELVNAYNGSREFLSRLVKECGYELTAYKDVWLLEKEINNIKYNIFALRDCKTLSEFIESLYINYTSYNEIYGDSSNDVVFKEVYRKDLNKIGLIL